MAKGRGLTRELPAGEANHEIVDALSTGFALVRLQLTLNRHGIGYRNQELVGMAVSTSLRAARHGWASSCSAVRLA